MIALSVTAPPSANRLWRYWRGRPVKSDEYRAWLSAAAADIQQQRAGVTLDWFSVSIALPASRRDGDNSIKPLLDACQAGGAVADDARLRGLRLDVLDDEGAIVRLELIPAAPPAKFAALDELRTRARECAASLLGDFRDRLTPTTYERALRVSRTDAGELDARMAEAMVRLYRKTVEPRA